MDQHHQIINLVPGELPQIKNQFRRKKQMLTPIIHDASQYITSQQVIKFKPQQKTLMKQSVDRSYVYQQVVRQRLLGKDNFLMPPKSDDIQTKQLMTLHVPISKQQNFV